MWVVNVEGCGDVSITVGVVCVTLFDFSVIWSGGIALGIFCRILRRTLVLKCRLRGATGGSMLKPACGLRGAKGGSMLKSTTTSMMLASFRGGITTGGFFLLCAVHVCVFICGG